MIYDAHARNLMRRFLSPKFFRKITYVDTLSELAYSVPLTQIDVPPAVYQYVSRVLVFPLDHTFHILLFASVERT